MFLIVSPLCRPYSNSTEPNPSRPFTTSSSNATTLQCEATCRAATPACVGFTRKASAAGEDLGACWFYSHVSGHFEHRPGSSVSWHPNPRPSLV